jgi:hypothetical protein
MALGVADVTPERRDELLLKVAEKIERFDLITPAIFFLQMSKPLSFVGSQALLSFAPIAGFIVNEKLLEEFGQVMADRENVERLMVLLEEREAQKKQAQKKSKKS